MNTSQILKASEISEYLFCSIAWYMRRCGHEPKPQKLERVVEKKVKKDGKTVLLKVKEEYTKLDEGINKHINIGKEITSLQKKEESSRSTFVVALLIILLSFIIFLVGWLL